jgi:hypothetical protein
MGEWRADISEALLAFQTVAELGRVDLSESDLQVEFLDAPHRPPTRLPTGKMAVYGFWGDGCWLKIGIAGPNSNARYTSQHYNAGSAPSTLAASLLASPAMSAVEGFDAARPGNWIRTSAHRVNILLPAEKPRELLALLEAFLHLRLRPRHER